VHIRVSLLANLAAFTHNFQLQRFRGIYARRPVQGSYVRCDDRNRVVLFAVVDGGAGLYS
jgi:hypothetical protein